MKKHIANIVTFSRVIAAMVLFTFKEIGTPFLIIYVFCAFTDFVDGPIA